MGNSRFPFIHRAYRNIQYFSKLLLCHGMFFTECTNILRQLYFHMVCLPCSFCYYHITVIFPEEHTIHTIRI